MNKTAAILINNDNMIKEFISDQKGLSDQDIIRQYQDTYFNQANKIRTKIKYMMFHYGITYSRISKELGINDNLETMAAINESKSIRQLTAFYNGIMDLIKSY